MQSTDNTDQVRISELAACLGINPKTIRYYEQLGLLPIPRRSSTGCRLYDATARDRLQFIRQAKAVGFTLAEIGEILVLQRDGERPCTHVLHLLDRKLTAVDEHLRTLTEFRRQLRVLRAEAAQTVQAEWCICPIIEQHGAVH